MGLLTARLACPGVSQAEILGDHPAEDVLTSMEMVTSALLSAWLPDDGRAARLLERLGLLAAAQGCPGDAT